MDDDINFDPFNLKDEDLNNEKVGKGRDTDRIRKFRHVAIADARRPVFGMLTEPLRGDLVNF